MNGDPRDFPLARKYRRYVCGGSGNLSPEAKDELALMEEYLASGGRHAHPEGFDKWRDTRSAASAAPRSDEAPPKPTKCPHCPGECDCGFMDFVAATVASAARGQTSPLLDRLLRVVRRGLSESATSEDRHLAAEALHVVADFARRASSPPATATTPAPHAEFDMLMVEDAAAVGPLTLCPRCNKVTGPVHLLPAFANKVRLCDCPDAATVERIQAEALARLRRAAPSSHSEDAASDAEVEAANDLYLEGMCDKPVGVPGDSWQVAGAHINQRKQTIRRMLDGFIRKRSGQRPADVPQPDTNQ